MIGRNLDDAEEWLRTWTSQVSAQAEAAQRMSERVAALTATAGGADGAIRVTVTSSGQLTALELDDRVQRMRGADLAKEIMRVTRLAQSRITAQVADVVAETVGTDTETGRAVLGSYEQRFPTPPEEPEHDRGR